MGSKPWLQPAPTYHPLETYWDTEDDAPGPRCAHTLTAVAQTKTQGPRLILFGGATAIEGGAAAPIPGIRLAGVTNSVHSYDVLTRKWTRIRPAGEPPSPRAAHAAAAVGTMVVFQGGIGPAGHSTDDLYVLDMSNDKYKWHRVVVQGQGPGPRYGHVMDLVAQRYLVTVSGNDDAWALDTAQKPYAWQRLNPEGDKPSARMYATASARSDGMFLLCGGRDTSGTVFVGARLHVTGGVVRGGRAVDGEAAVAVLDTAAGVWLDRHGLVTAPRKGQTEDPSLELMRRCRHAASSVGVRLYIYGGLRGEILLDDFLIAENSPFQSDVNSPVATSERASNVASPRTNNLTSAAEAEAANAVWQAAQAHAANPEETSVADDNSQAVVVAKEAVGNLGGLVISTLLRPRNWKPPANRRFFLDSYEVGELCYAAEQIFLHEPTVLQLKAPIKVFGDLHGQFGDLMRLFDEYGYPSTAGDITYIDYLFLGDYVDRGQHSLETITLLLALKAKNDGIWAWTRFNQLFNHLPLAALIEKKIICMHGGIGRSDPTENDSVEGLRPNARGPGLVTFGELNIQRPPTPTRGRPQDHDRSSLAYI
ncbi:Kelch-type beta propeller [Cynara cardunculus var. scolymus]|uniref:Kelch-type beta propeller n=1 Tax=Cynara cardunculus var. scolymus TaxID=59895 RepID=A0A103XPG1_CYNCS|nr:Kelch-type beta propeller [Cynara cardunculus var. scolymus]